MANKKQAWEKSSLEVKIIDCYECAAHYADKKAYYFDFMDKRGYIVEAEILKKEFKNLPYKMTADSFFIIVTYQEGSKLECSVWPTPNYWHNSLRGKDKPLKKKLK